VIDAVAEIKWQQSAVRYILIRCVLPRCCVPLGIADGLAGLRPFWHS
jgi:hypothetical protein